jgi:hypothetical protein
MNFTRYFNLPSTLSQVALPVKLPGRGKCLFVKVNSLIGFPVFRLRSAAAITEFIDADRTRWSKVIKAQNISLD